MKVLTIHLGDTETTEVHLLNVGEVFANFGGSRHDLRAGYDFDTRRKQRPQTASMILRQHGKTGFWDKEMAITEPAFWDWIAKLITQPGVKADT